MLKPLPTRTATFRDMINGGFLYIDKTEPIYHLLHRAKGAYFLSRPRRFGKSLLISTLDELFQGNHELFQGLWIDGSDYDWPVHPVIRLDFSRHVIRNVDDLALSIQTHLQRIGGQYNIFEFKLDKDARQALDQIEDKAYAQKYGLRGKAITQVGVSFDSRAGQVREWQVVD